MISRPLWATYVVTPEQKSSGILISELFEVRKWVVEKFHGISPGLVAKDLCINLDTFPYSYLFLLDVLS